MADFEGENVEELTVVDKNTLRIEKKDSYGSPGEEITYRFDLEWSGQVNHRGGQRDAA